MKRRVSSAIAVCAMVAASVGFGVAPAQASISRCNGTGGIGNIYYAVRCYGNPATGPNLYRAWVVCDYVWNNTGPWLSVEIADPDYSSAVCAYGTYVTSKGYNTV